MFGSKKKSTFSNATTLIARGTSIQGDIHFEGTLEIEGTIKGNITADPDSGASVRILEQGVVTGDLNVPTAIVNGKVIGNLYSNQHLELASQAIIDGSVHYNVIEMAKGAQVNGNLLHSVASEPLKAIEHLEKNPSE
jgi:cytoskeletal protein CcmA (bactofilin family)